MEENLIDNPKLKKRQRAYQWSYSRLKGSMAECIVEQMLRDSGYSVYRFGYEMILQHLKGVDLKESYVKRIITNMPDFIIVDNEGNANFLEIKYRKRGFLREYKEELEELGKWWGGGRIILCSYEEPCFRTSRIKEFIKTGKLYPLEKDKYLKVNKEVIKRYVSILKEYFEGK